MEAQADSARPSSSPAERGTDPLGDHGSVARSGNSRVRAIVFVVVGVLCAGLVIADFSAGRWGRAVFGVIVVALCAYAARDSSRR